MILGSVVITGSIAGEIVGEKKYWDNCEVTLQEKQQDTKKLYQDPNNPIQSFVANFKNSGLSSSITR